MGKLTQVGIRAALKEPGRHRDGDGLMLVVGKNGQASWICRYQRDGRRRDFGLGSLKQVSLAEAREKAREVKKALVENRDPHALYKPLPGMTLLFREVAREFINAKFSASSRKLSLSRLERYAFPALGKLQLQSIDADTIAECLRPIWLTKPETAKRVRQLIIRTLRYGRPDGALLETTLAKAVSDRLPNQPKRDTGFAAMPYEEVSQFMSKLSLKGGMGALALRAAVLTVARSGEVRGATWGELDLEARVWTIPAQRMKMRRAHRVPLSEAATQVFLKAAELRRRDTDLVFPSSAGKQLSDMTLTKVMRDMGEPYTVHGFRSAFRNWVAEQLVDVRDEVAEAALAHGVADKVIAAYKRTTFFEMRKDLMEAWGRFASGAATNVIPIRDVS